MLPAPTSPPPAVVAPVAAVAGADAAASGCDVLPGAGEADGPAGALMAASAAVATDLGNCCRMVVASWSMVAVWPLSTAVTRAPYVHTHTHTHTENTVAA